MVAAAQVVEAFASNPRFGEWHSPGRAQACVPGMNRVVGSMTQLQEERRLVDRGSRSTVLFVSTYAASARARFAGDFNCKFRCSDACSPSPNQIRLTPRRLR